MTRTTPKNATGASDRGKELVCRLPLPLYEELKALATSGPAVIADGPPPAATWTPAPGVTGANPAPAVAPHHPDAGPLAAPLPDPDWPLRYPDVEVSRDRGATWEPFPLPVLASLRLTCSDNRCHDGPSGILHRAVGSNADPADAVFHGGLTDAEYRDLLRLNSEWHRTNDRKNGGRRGH
jgi:hypothetical protein